MSTSEFTDEFGDLRLDPEPDAFRADVREFLADEMAPPRVAGHADPLDLTGLDEEFERAHHHRAGSRGYLGISVPAAFGGGGRPPSWRSIYLYEAAYHDAPSIDTAVTLCAPPIAGAGTPEQQQRWLPAMCRGEITGCIAYSERDAGSDLGALRTTAVPDGNGWRLDGEKVLVTGAHKADVCVTLARTDPDAPARTAFTVFLLPIDVAGLTVRREPTVNGWTLDDVVFDGVRVGDDARIGEVGGGWSVVLAAMAGERSGLAHLGWATRRVEDLARDLGPGPALDRAGVELAVARRFCMRVLRMQDEGLPIRGEASIAKLYVTELLQRLARAGAASVGPAALDAGPLFAGGNRWGYELIERVHPTISAGANEVQRDTVAALAFGLRS